MTEILSQNWPEAIAIIISLAALVVSVKAWHKSRAIYDIETEVVRQPIGSRADLYSSMKHITEKLSSGAYTVLAILERSKSDKDWEVFLGRIKPKKEDQNE